LTQCVNHPERAAVEECEVCQKALCAYCLYYTTDGQRLCADHERQAQAAGAMIKPPGAYADSLIASQLDASRPVPVKEALFEGDNVDLLALVGLVIGIISIMLCIPFGICFVGPVGLIASLLALVGANRSRDPSRTRAMASVGALLSSIWVLIFVACLVAYSAQVMTLLSFNTSSHFPITIIAPGMPQPQATTLVPMPTATARR
jgi:hypothetical protein